MSVIYSIIKSEADENIIQAITDEIPTVYSYDHGSSGSDMVKVPPCYLYLGPPRPGPGLGLEPGGLQLAPLVS